MRNVARVIVALFLLSGAARAASVLKLENDELTRRADVIFHGKCAKVSVRPGPTQAISAVTDYEFEVLECLKGDATAPVFTFTALGGKLPEGGGFVISGSPKYELGEEVILFLDVAHPKTGCRTAIGLAQGKFSVQAEPGSSKKHLVRDLGGLELVDKNGKVLGIQSAEGPRLYLEPFVKQVKAYVAAQRGGNK